MTYVAKIWRNRIEGETQLYSNCPGLYKDDVLTLLKEDVASGKITAEKFKEYTGTDYTA